MTWWFQIYQPWFHFSTFSHSKKQPPALAGLVRHLLHVMVSPIAAMLLGTWRYHDRLMKQISSIAFYEDFWPSNKTRMRLESESRKGLEMDLKRLKFEFNPESVDPGLHNNSVLFIKLTYPTWGSSENHWTQKYLLEGNMLVPWRVLLWKICLEKNRDCRFVYFSYLQIEVVKWSSR